MTAIYRCISWTAVSSEEQADEGKDSLADQRQENIEFIHNLGGRYSGSRGMLVDELEVQGSRRIIELSEARRAHDAYERLYQAIKQRSFDVLVAARWDRLGRTESLLATLRELCLDNKVVIAITSSPPRSLDPAEVAADEGWRIASTIQAWSSDREVRELSRRVKMGRRARVVKERKFLQIPFGYKHVYDVDGTRHTVIDEQQAEVVRLILVDWYLGQGWGKPTIAKELNARGIRTPEGSRWMSGTVDQVLQRRWIYGGHLEFGRHGTQKFERVEGTHDAILSDAELRAIEAEVQRRTTGPRRRYPLSGVIVCGECGQPMAGNRKLKQSARGVPVQYCYLTCRHCKNPSVREDAAMRELVAFVEYLQTLEDFSQFATDNGHDAEVQAIERKLALNEKQATEANGAIDRLLDAYETGILPQARVSERIQDRQDQIERLTAERESLQMQLAKLEATGTQTERAQDLADNGLLMLDKADEHPNKVRRWLLQNVRMIAKGGKISDIILLP